MSRAALTEAQSGFAKGAPQCGRKGSVRLAGWPPSQREPLRGQRQSLIYNSPRAHVVHDTLLNAVFLHTKRAWTWRCRCPRGWWPAGFGQKM